MVLEKLIQKINFSREMLNLNGELLLIRIRRVYRQIKQTNHSIKYKLKLKMLHPSFSLHQQKISKLQRH